MHIDGDWNTRLVLGCRTHIRRPGTDVSIGQLGVYTVTIAPGKAETVKSICLTNAGTTLAVSGTMTLTGTALPRSPWAAAPADER
jgi:hypothetical protein